MIESRETHHLKWYIVKFYSSVICSVLHQQIAKSSPFKFISNNSTLPFPNFDILYPNIMQGSLPSYNQAVAATAHQPHHIDTSLPVNVTASDRMLSPTLSDIEIQSFSVSTDCTAILGLFLMILQNTHFWVNSTISNSDGTHLPKCCHGVTGKVICS